MVSEKYLQLGSMYQGCRCAIKLMKPSSSTIENCWLSNAIIFIIFSLIAFDRWSLIFHQLSINDSCLFIAATFFSFSLTEMTEPLSDTFCASLFPWLFYTRHGVVFFFNGCEEGMCYMLFLLPTLVLSIFLLQIRHLAKVSLLSCIWNNVRTNEPEIVAISSINLKNALKNLALPFLEISIVFSYKE